MTDEKEDILYFIYQLAKDIKEEDLKELYIVKELKRIGKLVETNLD